MRTRESDVWQFALCNSVAWSVRSDSPLLVGRCCQLLLKFAHPALSHPMRVRGMRAQRTCCDAEVAMLCSYAVTLSF